MLSHVRIANLGVIKEASLDLEPGMTVLTGETGAGKTMVVTSLGLLLGQRADSHLVGIHEKKTVVEGYFDGDFSFLNTDMEMADDEELIISRQIGTQSRSRAFINGLGVPLTVLSDLTSQLATIHGQSGQIKLGEAERQRQLLDRAGGADHERRCYDYHELYEDTERLKRERDEIIAQAAQRAQEAEMLRFGIEQINDIEPLEGEDEQLKAEFHRLHALDQLRYHAHSALEALSGDDSAAEGLAAISLIARACTDIADLASVDSKAASLNDQIIQLSDLIAELVSDLTRYYDDLEADPARLEEINYRRSQLNKLIGRYGDTIDEVINWASNAQKRLGELNNDNQTIDKLTARIDENEKRLNHYAEQISQSRREAAERLGDQVHRELSALAMPHARICFELNHLDSLGPWGAESVHLTFAANAGSTPAPLTKVASGGELSRVRLALEVILNDETNDHLLVFDEVDAGIGGAVALEVGRRLQRLARHQQIIVVTHLAQVAAFADAHWKVEKSDDGQVTTSQVKRLEAEERIEELARMMGGDSSTSSALAHARDLLENCRDRNNR